MLIAANGDVQWGDLATWLAALLTGGSLLAAVKVLFLQRHDLNERDEDRRKDQARHIAAWCTGVDRESDASTPGPVVHVQYRNGSEEPVYEAVVYVKTTWDKAPSVAQVGLGTVPPSFVGDTDVFASLTQYEDVSYTPWRVYPPILVTFRDAAGRWWKRDEHGSLTAWRHKPDVMAEQTPPPWA